MCANMDWGSAIRVRRMAAQNALGPKYGDLKVGYACNNECLFCTVSWKKGHGNRDTQTLLKEVERLVYQDRVERMVYSGGEPTLCKDLAEVLRHAKQIGIAEQNIQTNGRGFRNMAYLETLHESGLTTCFVSIHGPDAPTHDTLTQRPGSFRETYVGLTNLDRLGIRFTTNTVVCKQNYRSVGSLIRLLGSSFPSIDKVKLSYPSLQGGAADNLSLIVAPLWELAPYIRAAIEIGDQLGCHVVTEYMPVCMLGTYYHRADEFGVPRVSLSELQFIDSNWTHPPGIFYEVCTVCDVRTFCRGVHPLHHEQFGDACCFTPISLTALGS